MREVRLWQPENAPKPAYFRYLQEELNEIEGKVKIYCTRCEASGMGSYILMTSSKDVHLGIGSLSKYGQFWFCHLLEEEFRTSNGAPFVLFIEQKSGGGLLVTRSTDADGKEIYHLSPAR